MEVKVRLGSVWKASLTELSGGQRSLIALSLIMSLLRFKPYVCESASSMLRAASLTTFFPLTARRCISWTRLTLLSTCRTVRHSRSALKCEPSLTTIFCFSAENIGRLFRTRFKGSQFIVVSLKDGLFSNANGQCSAIRAFHSLAETDTDSTRSTLPRSFPRRHKCRRANKSTVRIRSVRQGERQPARWPAQWRRQGRQVRPGIGGSVFSFVFPPTVVSLSSCSAMFSSRHMTVSCEFFLPS